MAGTITRYQPTTINSLPDVVNRMFNEGLLLPSFFDRQLSRLERPFLPVNLVETQDGFIMQAAVPGLKFDTLEIQVMGRELSLKGEFGVQKPENGSWLWHGLPDGEFYETYTLPAEIDSEKVEAHYQDGIVALALPKAEHLRPKKIKVTVR